MIGPLSERFVLRNHSAYIGKRSETILAVFFHGGVHMLSSLFPWLLAKCYCSLIRNFSLETKEAFKKKNIATVIAESRIWISDVRWIVSMHFGFSSIFANAVFSFRPNFYVLNRFSIPISGIFWEKRNRLVSEKTLKRARAQKKPSAVFLLLSTGALSWITVRFLRYSFPN